MFLKLGVVYLDFSYDEIDYYSIFDDFVIYKLKNSKEERRGIREYKLSVLKTGFFNRKQIDKLSGFSQVLSEMDEWVHIFWK
jgi:hypothetical protein